MLDTSLRIRCLCNADLRNLTKSLTKFLDITLEDASYIYIQYDMEKAADQGD